MTLVLTAQTLQEVTAQACMGLLYGYAVEVDSRYTYTPVDWYPPEYRSRMREELAVLGVRVADGWTYPERSRCYPTAPGPLAPNQSHI